MKLRSNEPFWLVKNGILHSYASLTEDLNIDVLVIGGGITGALIAHQCVEDGFKTALVDRREIAHGSSSATTSMLQYEVDTPLYELIEMIGEEGAVASYQACFDSIDTLGKLCRKIRSKCGFRKKRSLYFAALKKDVAWLKREFEARKAHGFPVKWLEAEEIEKSFDLKGSYGGILSDQGGSIDAFHFTHELLAFNAKRGLAIHDKTEVRKVAHRPSGIKATTEDGNTIKARKIIYCNGFESVEIIKDKFVNLLSTYAIVGEVMEKECEQWNDMLFWNTAEPYIYMRTTDDGRLLIGGEDEEFVDAAKRDSLLSDKSAKLEKQITKLFPDTPFRTDFAWAGTFGETKDGLPYIGKHPNFPGAYFVLGFGGNGITFSVIGMEMVSGMLHGKKHPLDKFFRFRR